MPVFAVTATEAWLANRNRRTPFIMRFHIPVFSRISCHKCTRFAIDCQRTIRCYYIMRSTKMQTSSSQQAAHKHNILIFGFFFFVFFFNHRILPNKHAKFTPCKMKKTYWAAETMTHCWNTRVRHVLLIRNIGQDVTNTHMKHTGAT